MDKRLAVMLNAILQLEAQGECRESATEAVLMVGYTSDGVSNQEQIRWLYWNVDGGLRGHGLARIPGFISNTEYEAVEFNPFRPDRQQEQGLSPLVNHRRCSARNKQKSSIRISAA